MMATTVCSTLAICVTVGLLGFQTPCDGADRPVERFKFDSGAQLEKLVNDLNYTPEAWQAGVARCPDCPSPTSAALARQNLPRA